MKEYWILPVLVCSPCLTNIFLCLAQPGPNPEIGTVVQYLTRAMREQSNLARRAVSVFFRRLFKARHRC